MTKIWINHSGSDSKESASVRETQVLTLGWEDPLEKGSLPTPVFLPREFHGQTSLGLPGGSSPWDYKQLDTTEQLITFFQKCKWLFISLTCISQVKKMKNTFLITSRFTPLLLEGVKCSPKKWLTVEAGRWVNPVVVTSSNSLFRTWQLHLLAPLLKIFPHYLTINI